jgi:hypothetical protein
MGEMLNGQWLRKYSDRLTFVAWMGEKVAMFRNDVQGIQY